MREKIKNQKGCWYFITIRECAICGATDTTRERQPPSAPPPEKRIDYSNQTACDYHFL